MVTHPPGHGALLTGSAGLVGLALDAQVHDVVAGKVPVIFHSNLIQTLPANCTVIHHNVPGPESHGVPLLHLEPFLVLKLGDFNKENEITKILYTFPLPDGPAGTSLSLSTSMVCSRVLVFSETEIN